MRAHQAFTPRAGRKKVPLCWIRNRQFAENISVCWRATAVLSFFCLWLIQLIANERESQPARLSAPAAAAAEEGEQDLLRSTSSGHSVIIVTPRSAWFPSFSSVLSFISAEGVMTSVWKRLQRVGKKASKFQFVASYQELILECTKKWWVFAVCVFPPGSLDSRAAGLSATLRKMSQRLLCVLRQCWDRFLVPPVVRAPSGSLGRHAVCLHVLSDSC